MRIEVTHEDIERGRPKSREACPIAHAIRRQSNLHFIEVNPCTLRWCEGSKVKRRPLPEEARDFIREFDNAGPVRPFAFDINIPKDEKRVSP